MATTKKCPVCGDEFQSLNAACSTLCRVLHLVADDMGSCWNWTGAVMWKGYGALRVDGKVMRVHRLAWEMWRGPIPDGKLVLHHCDNRRCCNPDHLYVGTPKQNTEDMMRRDRWANQFRRRAA